MLTKKFYFFKMCAVPVFFVITLLVLTSCQTNMKVSFFNEKKEKYWIIPNLNEVSTAFIGDSLLREGTSALYDAIILKKDYRHHTAGTYKYIGDSTRKLFDKEGNLIGHYPVKVYQSNYLIMPGLSDEYMQIYEKEDGTVWLNNISGNTQVKEGEYERETLLDVNDYYFDQQLIYTGSDGKTLKFTYREFADGTARPSFTVDATYDLSKGNIIRFQGATLEILDYDNQTIRYKVLNGFKS